MATVKFKRLGGCVRASYLRMTRVLEELIPFVFYWLNSRKLRAQADHLAEHGSSELEAEYLQLDKGQLSARLKKEHTRGVSIDEKTAKLTLTFSIAIALTSSVGSYFVDSLEGSVALSGIVAIANVAAIFALVSGLISVRALTTLPTYGYGTSFVAKATDELVVARSLMAQEKINALRQVRNEAAYQCLRNSLCCLVIAVALLCVEPWLGQIVPEKKVPRGRWAPSNNTLQVTFDPLRPFAAAKVRIASNAPE